MALQTSGPISISEIQTELGSSDGSLATLSLEAGFSAPHAMSEFYGYTASTGTISDIEVSRSVSGANAGIVTITSTSYPQVFQDPYFIVQDFVVYFYNYQYNYSSAWVQTGNFAFFDTNLNSSRTLYFGVPPQSYPTGISPTGAPALNNPNGLPINLVV